MTAYIFEHTASGRLLAACMLALLPLLAEAALTFIVCTGYLRKRPLAASIPSSLKSILLINVVLTLLLLCSTLAEGMVVSAKPFFEKTPFLMHLAARVAAMAVTPSSTSAAIVESLQRQEQELAGQEYKGSGGFPFDLLATAMVWMVVLVYVGVVASIGLNVGCRSGSENDKSAWNMKSMRGMMRVLDRNKWVGLCLAVVFSTWGLFLGFSHGRSMYVLDEGHQQGKHEVMAVLLEMATSVRVWKWTVASSTIILLAVLSLCTIAARLALYLCCKRFSLQDDDADQPLNISLA